MCQTLVIYQFYNGMPKPVCGACAAGLDPGATSWLDSNGSNNKVSAVQLSTAVGRGDDQDPHIPQQIPGHGLACLPAALVR